MVEHNDDQVRDLILRHLYESHRSGRGRGGGAQGISQLQSALRSKGLKQQDVSHNLDYLVQKGWVREVVQSRAFTTPGGTQRSAERITYKVSDVGMDRLQVASVYQRPPIGGAINITTIQGVTIVGNDNVVNTAYTELSRTLNDARQLVIETQEISAAEKLDAIADIDTLQSQLQRPTPRREIIANVWNGLEKTLTAAGLVDLAIKIGGLLGPLLG